MILTYVATTGVVAVAVVVVAVVVDFFIGKFWFFATPLPKEFMAGIGPVETSS